MSWQEIALATLLVATAAAMVVWRRRVVTLAVEGRVFMGEVVEEVKKITWPGRVELRQATLVTLAFVLVCALVIGAMDLLLQFFVVRLPGRLV